LIRPANHFTFIAARIVALAAIMVPIRAHAGDTKTLRPPAVPLVTFDPYLSIWSEADHLNDDVTRHWTHHEHPLVSLIRIDGTTYRLMGTAPQDAPAFPQQKVVVLPTRSIYDFDDSHVHVTMTFMTTALPHDLEALGRPLSYITWNVRSVDGANHSVSLYDSASAQLTVNTPTEKVTWKREAMGPLMGMSIGTESQPILALSGDDVRINWGYAYLAAPSGQVSAAIGAEPTLLSSFVKVGTLPVQDDTRMPRAANDDSPTMAVSFDLGSVNATAVSRHVMVAYDEIYAIKYFGKRLRPYWRRNGATPASLLQAAEHDYATLTQRCEQFDRDLMADLTKAGGEKYAQIVALSYRQCLAATGLAADANRQPLLFTKENTSNGDIATVDVIFPMAPMMLFLSPTLSKAMLVSDLDYAASAHWKFPNAPHDLGTYPIVRGTDDGGEGMPVEESGNILLICDAIAKSEGNADFVAKWWPQLTQWEQYLEKYGNDPEDQLCTDDFMGHLAHNANLSIKAILAIAAYGDLCRIRGDHQTADKLQEMARGYAHHWVEAAGDGNHSRLAFDKPNTWSQKYNLVWDKILDLHVFPPAVAQQEVAYYKSVMQPYGVPLDSRTRLTKTDWSFWSATMADKQADFEAFISPIYDYLDHTAARSPLVDSYITDDIKSDGMHARSVVGGLFVKMLTEPTLWKKWAGGDHTKAGNWAPLPPRPLVTEILATGRQAQPIWRYTITAPPADWTKPGFDASAWQEGPAGFGTAGTPGVAVHTNWNTDDIWLRREITVPATAGRNLQFLVFHDEDVEIYVNGVLASSEAGFITTYDTLPINADALALLKPGAKVLLAVHCHQTTGGQGIDVGLANVTEK
jgi:hypothetical protein